MAVETMQSGPNERTANYTDKLVPAYIKDYLVANKDGMSFRVGVAIDKRAQIETRTKAVLGGENVNSILYAAYIAFSLEVWKAIVVGHLSGTAAVNEVALLVYKSKTRGLTEAILDKVRDEVFAIPAPGAPLGTLSLTEPD